MAEYQSYLYGQPGAKLTWPIAIEFLRALFSLFRALKENFRLSPQAFITEGSGYHVLMDIKKIYR